MESAET